MTPAAVIRRLIPFIEAHQGQPFAWGERDCHTLVLLWLDQLTGGERSGYAVGRYGTIEGAREWANGFGRDLAEVIREAGGAVVPADQMQAGDIVLVPDHNEPWFRSHICAGVFLLSAWPGRGCRLEPITVLPDRYIVMRVPCQR